MAAKINNYFNTHLEVPKEDYVTYTMNLDDLDISSLYIKKSLKRWHNGEVLPIWDIGGFFQKREFFNSIDENFCEFEITAKKSDDEDTKDIERKPYTCHICNIKIPNTCIKQHIQSDNHKTLLKLANTALERINKYISQQIIVDLDIEQQYNIDAKMFYCIPCNILMEKKVKHNHEIQNDHKIAIKRAQFIAKLLEIYTEEIDKEDIHKENDKDALTQPKKTRNSEEIKTKDCDLQNHFKSRVSTFNGAEDKINIFKNDYESLEIVKDAYFCDVCNVKVPNTSVNITEHNNGKSHRNKILEIASNKNDNENKKSESHRSINGNSDEKKEMHNENDNDALIQPKKKYSPDKIKINDHDLQNLFKTEVSISNGTEEPFQIIKNVSKSIEISEGDSCDPCNNDVPKSLQCTTEHNNGKSHRSKILDITCNENVNESEISESLETNDVIPDNGQMIDKLLSRGNFTIEELNEPIEISTLSGDNIKISKMNWHGIAILCLNKNGSYCRICEEEFPIDLIADHIKTVHHKKLLSIPIVDRHGLRKMPESNKIHCILCNSHYIDVYQTSEDHVLTPEHHTYMEQALTCPITKQSTDENKETSVCKPVTIGCDICNMILYVNHVNGKTQQKNIKQQNKDKISNETDPDISSTKLNVGNINKETTIKETANYSRNPHGVVLNKGKFKVADIDNDNVEVTAVNGDVVRVNKDNWHSTIRMEVIPGKKYYDCQLCHFYEPIEKIEEHIQWAYHVDLIESPVPDKHCLRQNYHNEIYCTLCQQTIFLEFCNGSGSKQSEIDKHISCVRHQKLLEKALVSANTMDPKKQADQTITKVNKGISATGTNSKALIYSLEDGARKMNYAKNNKPQENNNTTKPLENKVISDPGTNIIKCDTCNIKVHKLCYKEHLNGNKHRKQFNNLKTANKDKVAAKIPPETKYFQLMPKIKNDACNSKQNTIREPIKKICKICNTKIANTEEMFNHDKEQNHIEKLNTYFKNNNIVRVKKGYYCSVCKKYIAKSTIVVHCESPVHKMAMTHNMASGGNICRVCNVEVHPNIMEEHVKGRSHKQCAAALQKQK